MNDSDREPGRDVAQLVEGCNKFAVAMYARLAHAQEQNLIFSPSSLALALAMTLSGASGETARELAQALNVAGLGPRVHDAFQQLRAATRSGGIELRIANRLWGQQGYSILADFLTTTRTCYEAEFAELDFQTNPEQACQSINRWVDEVTAHKISEIINPGMLDKESRLVLTNAIYFLGAWEHEFQIEQTFEAPFYVSPSDTVAVPMMRQSDWFRYGEFEDLQVLEMPYRSRRLEFRTERIGNDEIMAAIEVPEGGSDFTMCILLPKPGASLAEIEGRLSTQTLRDWMTLRNCQVHLTIPKFRLESGLEMTEQLEELGIRRAFSRSGADFSRMTKDPEGLYIGSVAHKAFVDVNEKGTEAAAVTVVWAAGGAAMEGEPPKEFKANRPFLFCIRDRRTKLIYFMGRVVNPAAIEP